MRLTIVASIISYEYRFEHEDYKKWCSAELLHCGRQNHNDLRCCTANKSTNTCCGSTSIIEWMRLRSFWTRREMPRKDQYVGGILKSVKCSVAGVLIRVMAHGVGEVVMVTPHYKSVNNVCSRLFVFFPPSVSLRNLFCTRDVFFS